MPESYQPPINWNEEMTRLFLDYGRYFVPGRSGQFKLISSLIPASDEPFRVLELGCGDGLLAREILERHPQAAVHLLDGSQGMLDRASQNLADHPGRFTTGLFALEDAGWRSLASPIHGLPEPAWAVVSSMTIHHLDRPAKESLYADMLDLLAPGGALVIADMIEPASPEACLATAAALDETVKSQSLAIDGNLMAFEFFQREGWNYYRFPDEMDKPSPIFEQLKWLEQAGYIQMDVYWMQAGHAVFGGRKPSSVHSSNARAEQ